MRFLVVSITRLFVFALILVVPSTVDAAKALYVRGSSYYQAFDSILADIGLEVTISDDIPSLPTLEQYRVVLVNSYSACNGTTAEYLRQYLQGGGGVVLISGTPLFLGLPTITPWFGATGYINSGGPAYYVDNPAPFETAIADGALLTDHTGSGSDAAVTGVLEPTHVLGRWQDGRTMCFWNTYGSGRMFYHGSMYAGTPQLNEYNNATLWKAGLRWAADMQYTYFAPTGHWYKCVLIPPNFTWHQCRDSAVALGGYLATSTTQAENWFLADLARPYASFLGGTDQVTEGVWQWVTGEPWGYQAWRSGEPNNAWDDEDYIGLSPLDSLWNDMRNWFIDPQAFVAEWNYYPPNGRPTIIHVPGDQPTIQAGINAAVNGDTVLVAPGTYLCTGLSLQGKIITVASNFILDSLLSTVETTVIDGGSLGSVFVLSNGPVGQKIIGLTIRRGSGSIWESPPVPYGGAMLIVSGGPIICNNIFVDNTVNGFGGAIYIAGSRARIEHNIFRNNSALKGGAIYVSAADSSFVSNNQFSRNNADSGGALFCSAYAEMKGRVSNCVFDTNSSRIAGGAICRSLGSRITIDSCLFRGNASASGGAICITGETVLGNFVLTNSNLLSNSATEGGGGLWANHVSGGFLIRKCLLRENVAQGSGGGIGLDDAGIVRIDSSIFAANRSDTGSGGAVYWYNTSNSILSRCTFVENEAPVVGGSALSIPLADNTRIEGVVFAFNGTGSAVATGNNCSVAAEFTACDFFANAGGHFSGLCAPQLGVDGNFTNDPLFCDTASLDYHIRNSSPCHPDSTVFGLIGAVGVGCFGDPIAGIGVVGESELLHLVNHTPAFWWSCLRDDGFAQSAFQLEIGTDNDWSIAELWSTGIIQIADTMVIYAGGGLNDSETYHGRLWLSGTIGPAEWHEFAFRMNSVPSVPVIANPSGDQIVTGSPVLWVDNSSDNENDPLLYDFRLVIDTANGEPQLIEGLGIPAQTDSTGWSVAALLQENARYHWQARAYDGYEYSDWTGSVSFYLDQTPEAPAPYTLITPPLQANVPEFHLKTSFDWADAPDPDPFDTVRYTLEISISPNFTFTYTLGPFDQSAHVLVDSLEFNTHYWWRVKATDKDGFIVTSSVVHDFWTWLPGDVDYSHNTDGSDLQWWVDFMYFGMELPSPRFVLDLDGDCVLDGSDSSILIDYIFFNGPPWRGLCVP